MDLRDLVHALLMNEVLTARQWVKDAVRAGLRWEEVASPAGLDATGMAVAAGVAELLAERGAQEPPAWTVDVEAAPEPVFLVQAARTMPRLRRACELEGPMALRKRGIYAPPEFLTGA